MDRAAGVTDDALAEAVVKGLSALPIRWLAKTRVSQYDGIDQSRWNLVMQAVLETAATVEGAKAVKMGWISELEIPSHCGRKPEIFTVVKEPYRKGFDDSEHEFTLLACINCGFTWWRPR